MGSTVFLVLMGALMVYSAASVSDYVNFEDSAYHFKRQILFAGVGLVAMYLAQAFDFRLLRRLAWPIYFACVAGLTLVLTMGVGKWGATRWIDLGFMTVQPSEYAKLACVLVAAVLLEQWRNGSITGQRLAAGLFASCGAVVGLVMGQPDLGTTLSIAASVFVVLLLGGVSGRLLLAVATAGGLVATGFVFSAAYRAERFFAFLNPWADPQGSGYQSIQAMLAFGSGGIAGLGVGMSRQKFFYLPAAHTDFVFAIIGEELGLIGALSVVLAFGLFTYAGIRIALGCKDRFGRLLVGGLTGMIAIQAIMNMAAVTSLMPVTGIPMPLVSYGGSSMTFTLACIGIILSVSSHGMRQVGSKRSPVTDKEQASARADERRRNGRSHLSGIDGGRALHKRRA
ncbi:MAG: putative lipid II flippase FtsW [Coriobacteriia bacterium]|nr:putative lipid II flippase FtsW [Coriobacteriia bacterium]